MDFTKEEILEYFKKTISGFKVSRSKIQYFPCPICGKENSATLLPITNKFNCLSCKTSLLFFDLIRKMEDTDIDDDEIIKKVCKIIGKPLCLKPDAEFMFVYYSSFGFKLIPVSPENKRPIYSDWTNRGTSDKKEWNKWLGKYNFGLLTGEINNITVVDFDKGEVPLCFMNSGTLFQETNKGYHFVFKYNPKYKNTRISNDDFAIDILGDGKQIVIPPSILGEKARTWNNLNDPLDMSEEVELFLDGQLKGNTSIPNQLQDDTNNLDNEFVSGVNEGDGRNNMLIHLGGILKKDLSLTQCANVLSLINQKFFTPPLNSKEIGALLGSLDKYISYDEKHLAYKILEYLKLVGFANTRDITSHDIFMQHKKLDIDKALAFLVIEKMAYKKGRNYFPITKTVWHEELVDTDIDLKVDVPFFSKYAKFVDGDMLLLGASSGVGKTTLSMNILKHFVKQKIKPCYFSNEVGSRFKRTAIKLGLVTGDFRYSRFSNPLEIELEPNAVTIVDWILPDNYAETDKLMAELGRKVTEAGGLLIVFMQLKDDKTWYSRAMSQFFPAFTARYLYEDESGTNAYFQVDKVREAKIQIKNFKIPCRYNFETKEVEVVND